MAHFAKLDDNNIVIEVNVVNNSDINDLPFPESEPVGISFLTQWSGGYTNWKQTSYNYNFRKNHAGVGYKYDPELDVFIPPQPYSSWILNKDVYRWEPPISYPKDEKVYIWDETTKSWVEAEK